METASFWANIAFVTFTVLAAISGVIVLVLANRVGAARNAALDRLQAESAAAIASAEARAAEANQVTAESNERASAIEQDNLKLRADAALANAQAEKSKAERAKLEMRALELARTNPALADDATPRTLTPEQRSILQTRLSSWKDSDVKLNTYSSQSEARTFAGEVSNALSEAGLKVHATNVLDGTGTGFGFAVHSKEDFLPLAEAIANAFTAAGLQFGIFVDPSIKEGEFFLFVGVRQRVASAPPPKWE